MKKVVVTHSLKPTELETISTNHIKDRFSRYLGVVGRGVGFIRNELQIPRPAKFNPSTMKWEHDKTKGGVYLFKTWWRSFEDFEKWRKNSHLVGASSILNGTQIDIHEVFLSTDDYEHHTAKIGEHKQRMENCPFVVTNNIPVAKAHESEFEERFSHRVHLVDQANGFLRNEVHRPKLVKYNVNNSKWENDNTKQGYYKVSTWWRRFEDFEAWTKSEAFATAHKQKSPKEMFAGASYLEIHEVLLNFDVEDVAPSGFAPLEFEKSLEKTFTLQELSHYRNPPTVYISLKGDVFDVSTALEFYGPKGPYHAYAGHDATRGLGKMSMDPKDIIENQSTEDFTEEEIKTVNSWHQRFKEKYPIVGRLISSPKL